MDKTEKGREHGEGGRRGVVAARRFFEGSASCGYQTFATLSCRAIVNGSRALSVLELLIALALAELVSLHMYGQRAALRRQIGA